jgi:hypothetical protein
MSYNGASFNASRFNACWHFDGKSAAQQAFEDAETAATTAEEDDRIHRIEMKRARERARILAAAAANEPKPVATPDPPSLPPDHPLVIQLEQQFRNVRTRPSARPSGPVNFGSILPLD